MCLNLLVTNYNFFLSCNLSFTRPLLKCFLPWSVWIILCRWNTIREFATSFPSLILHAVNLLVWKKTFLLTLVKIIAISRPNTLLRDFLMGRSECLTKGRNWGGGISRKPKILNFLLLSDTHTPPSKHWVPSFHSWSQTEYLKRYR